jgi:hypothetical protein
MAPLITDMCDANPQRMRCAGVRSACMRAGAVFGAMGSNAWRS